MCRMNGRFTSGVETIYIFGFAGVNLVYIYMLISSSRQPCKRTTNNKTTTTAITQKNDSNSMQQPTSKGVAFQKTCEVLHVRPFWGDFCSNIWLGHVTCKEGFADDPIFWIPDPNLPIHYTTFYGATMTIKGSLLMSIAIVKAFWADISPVKNWPQISVWGKMRSGCKILFSGPPKKHYFLARNDVIWLLIIKICAMGLTVGR